MDIVMDKKPESGRRRMRPAMHSCAGWAPLLPPRTVDDAVVVSGTRAIPAGAPGGVPAAIGGDIAAEPGRA